jgi:hypothetical protein
MQQQTELPDKVERKVSNRNGDEWYEYDGEQLFSDDALDRIRNRFAEMREQDFEKIATVKGSSSTKSKIRTKDLESFKEELRERHNQWVEEHGDPLTSFGQRGYGEQLTQAIEISDENPRKTVVRADYNAGYRAFMGGEDGKKQDILLVIREYEQWSYQTEVVEPLFEKYNEKYPY